MFEGQMITEAIDTAWRSMVEREERHGIAQPRRYIYASGWRECERRMFLECAQADKVPPYDVATLARFRRGKQREVDLSIQLMKVGQQSQPQFSVENQQEAVVLHDRKGRKAISGRVDGFLNFDGQRVPFETKSWDFNITRNMKTLGDLLANKWTRSGAYQLLAYCFGTNSPLGLFVLDRPTLPRLVPVSFLDHLDEMESFLSTAERILDHFEQNTAPPYHHDPAVCLQCPLYGALCQPPITMTATQIITDEEEIQLLERRSELETAATEYENLDRQFKKKYRGIETAIAGPFLLEGKFSTHTTYEVPDAVKQQYKRVDPQGKFTLSIKKIGPNSNSKEIV